MPEVSFSAPREIRFRWYRQVEQENRTVGAVCSIFAISRKTYYKWYRHDHGLGSNEYKQRAPHPATKIKGAVRVLIAETKRQYNFGPKKMREYVKQKTGITISANAIYKFYSKRHLIRKPRKKQSWYAPMKEPYYARIPGENVQLDVKYVPGYDGSWHYQYRFIDTVTNMQYATETLIKDARATIHTLHSALRSFPFTLQGIQTDNGSEFRGVFHTYLMRKGITHRYIPKRSAPWNGKVERANRSVDDEFYLNPGRPWKRLYQYTRWYNHERPHLGKNMNGLTPYQKYLTFVTH